MDDESVEPARPQEVQWKQVGKIKYDESDVLGTGCEGTQVFRGEFDGRKVAVKKVLKYLPERENEILKESDFHQNVIRYFFTEYDDGFRYLALELCVASLKDYGTRKDVRDSLNISQREILRQSTDGLDHLHSLKPTLIVHRDLKPQNVLFFINGSGKTVMKLSDFGISKKAHPGRDELTNSSGAMGTEEWMAPEVLIRETPLQSSRMDIFSLGCIFYYVLTEGNHPFGETHHRKSNIAKGEYSLQLLASEDYCLPFDLISLMISSSPSLRPSASAILIHPFFWETRKILDFLCYVSDLLTREVSGSSILLDRLEKNGIDPYLANWHSKVCEIVLPDLLKIRAYKEDSVRDLLRAIRNYAHHYRERPVPVREALGEYTDGIAVYFTSRFPNLLLHVYKALEMRSDEDVFVPFYTDDVRTRIKSERDERENKVAETTLDATIDTTTSPPLPSGISTCTTFDSNSQPPPTIPAASEARNIPFQANVNSNYKPIGVLEQLKQVDGSTTTSSETRAPSQSENWIGLLSQFCLKNKLQEPDYRIEGIGPFAVYVTVGDFNENGNGKKKQEARAAAARKLYEKIQKHKFEDQKLAVLEKKITPKGGVELPKPIANREKEMVSVPVISSEKWVEKLLLFCNANKLPSPEYETEETVSPFTTHVKVGDFKEKGTGTKKKESRAEAAKILYKVMQAPGFWIVKLSEFCAKKKMSMPEITNGEDGPPFTAQGTVGIFKESGIGSSKKEARGDVAKKLYAIVQADGFRESTVHWKGEVREIEEEKDTQLERLMEDASIDVSQAYSVDNPHKAVEEILSDQNRFLPNYSLKYREVDELSSLGRVQCYLTVRFTMVSRSASTVSLSKKDHLNRVFGGEGIDARSAKEEAARAALIHFLTYE